MKNPKCFEKGIDGKEVLKADLYAPVTVSLRQQQHIIQKEKNGKNNNHLFRQR